MEKEDFASYELSQALKSKGFREPCLYTWRENIDHPLIETNKPTDFNSCYTTIISAPFLYQVLKWFRKNHNIIIESHYEQHTKKYQYSIDNCNKGVAYMSDNEFNEPEKALEAGIKNMLAII